MYFNGKTFFNQDTNMRVVGDQRNPPPRRKGVRKKKITKKKGGKVDMKKLKSLFGGDIIVKLLLSLVDKQSRGPNLKSEGRKQLGEGKVKKMRQARGGGSFQTNAQVKAERAKQDKERRIAQASVIKPGETQEDVLNRLIKEVAVGGDPASLAFLKANTIPPELRKLVGKMSVYGEAYFDKDITPAKKKSLERTIIKEVINGIGGDVRKEFIKTATDDEDIVEGFKEGVEALKKQGYKNAEKIIQQKDKIEKELKEKREETTSPAEAEEVDKALTGLEVVLFTGNTNTGNLSAESTDAVIDEIQSNVGRNKQTKDKKIELLIKFAENENSTIQAPGENRNFFMKFIEDGIDLGSTNAQIKSKIKTRLKALEKGKELKEFEGKKSENVVPKATRADASIFTQGAVANKPDQYNIKLPDGTTKLFDGEKVNPNIRRLNKQIRLFEAGNQSEIGTKKELKRFKRELEEERKLFREQLVRLNEGLDFKPEPGFNKIEISKKSNDDLDKLADDLKKVGIILPEEIKFGKGETITGIGEEGYTLKSSEGFSRYIEYEQKKHRKEIDKIAKRDAVEKKQLRKAGIKVDEQKTDLQQLIEDLPNPDAYRLGILNTQEIEDLPPRLKADYPDTKKIADKEKKEKDKTAIAAPKQRKVALDDDEEEGTIFDKTTGRAITKEDLAADPFAAFDALGAGDNLLTQEEAEEKQRETIYGGKFFEDLTAEEIKQIQDEPVEYDSFGNIIDKFSGIPRKPKTAEEEAELKKQKKDNQTELIERYKVDKSVLKDIKIAGRKKLTTQGLYTLTKEELDSMSTKERKKYEAVIANRTAIQQSVYGEGGKEEADRLLLLRNQGKDLTDEEINKISYADRKSQGLLSDKEVEDIKDKKDKSDYFKKKKRIDDQIEAVKVRERKEIIGDTLVEGGDFDRLKEQADYFGQTRKELGLEQQQEAEEERAIDELEEQLGQRYISPDLSALEPEVERRPTPPKNTRGGGIDTSINAQGNQQQSLDAAGPKKRGRPRKKKPENIGDALNAALGGGVSEAEKERKKAALKKLDEQQKELLREQKEFFESQGINPERKSTAEEQDILKSIYGGRQQGSESDEDFSNVFDTGDFPSDDDGGEQDYLLEGD